MEILIMESSGKFSDEIANDLLGIGHKAEFIINDQELKQKIKNTIYDCIVVDLTDEENNGIQLIDEVKRINKHAGLIVISSDNSFQKKIDALYQGADDFLNKPYEVSELVARIFSLLRRSKLSSKNIIRYNELQIDLLAKSVLVNEVLLGLTKKEFELLVFFLEHKNKVVTKDALLTYLSGQLEDSKSNADIIYAHIKNLKRKMNDAGCKIYLNTIYGIGYKWED